VVGVFLVGATKSGRHRCPSGAQGLSEVEALLPNGQKTLHQIKENAATSQEIVNFKVVIIAI